MKTYNETEVDVFIPQGDEVNVGRYPLAMCMCE
jgi:hypothetical protein